MTSYSPNRHPNPRWLRKKIRQRDNHTCQQCGKPGNEVDHIIPISQGGTDHPNNLQVLCATCHTTKTRTEQHAGTRRKQALLHLPTEQHPGITPN